MEQREGSVSSGKNGSLHATGLAKAFRSGSGSRTQVLENCSIDVESGKLTVLMGPSGCGKSTLAHILAGYIAPDAGSIICDGAPVQGAGPDRLMVFQETALWPWMSVIDNVTFGPLVRAAIPRTQARQRAEALLQRFGLSLFQDKFPYQLSGGMQRRVEIAQALINSPKVMILDEPFRGLDIMTRELMQEYYLSIFEDLRLTTLFITPEIDEAIFLADRILVMAPAGGAIVDTIEVDLPRPRHFELLASDRYQVLQAHMLQLLDREQEDPAVETPPPRAGHIHTQDRR
jgi:NitT/TauT family transport system ATP-binding protein